MSFPTLDTRLCILKYLDRSISSFILVPSLLATDAGCLPEE
jgi:hypothetical protein